MFLVFSNFDFQFLSMTSRGGQYFYRFSSACRLIEYNSSIFPVCNLERESTCQLRGYSIIIIVCLSIDDNNRYVPLSEKLSISGLLVLHIYM